MNKQRFFLLLIPALLSCFPLFAQTDRYDAVYLSLVKEYTLNPDGSMDSRCRKVQQLQNYQSFHRLFGETFIVYNPENQHLRIHEAYTIMADGKKVITPENGFNEVLPRFAALAPDFNGLREMVITHTGLEIGATIHLTYEIHSDKGFFPAFMGSEILAETQPVKELTITIKIPEDISLFYHIFNSVLKSVQTTENGFKIYTWSQSDISAIPADDHQPLHNAADPFLIFSTQDTYQKLVSWFAGQEARKDSLSGSMDDMIVKLVAEKKEPAALAFALQGAVVNDLRLYDIPDELTGYRLRSPIRVWDSNGGTPAEKAVLLASMLKRGGIEAKPVLVFNESHFDERVASLTELDEWIVKAEIPTTGPIYLSVKQVNAYDMTVLMPGQIFLEMNPDGSFELSQMEKGRGAIKLTGNFEIKPDFVFSGKINGSLSGSCNPRLALLRDSSKLKYYLGGGIASPELKGIELNLSKCPETTFSCNVLKENTMKKDSSFRFLPLPFLKTGVENLAISSLVAVRSVPFELPAKLDESYIYSISIPDNLIPVTSNSEIQITNEAGSFLFKINFKAGVVDVTKEMHLKQATISPDRYRDFKELMDNWNLRQTRELIFRTD
ncbi:MAG: DUF3857 domain-containing protein [bacterium]